MRVTTMVLTVPALLVACGDINVPGLDVPVVACSTHTECQGKVNDLSPCQEAGCDMESGKCVALDLPDGFDCDDGDPCTIEDWCFEGDCVGKPRACDDQNPCTNDFCNVHGDCDAEPNDEPCDDGDRCTLDDVCGEGQCQPGKGVPDCDDGNPCTEDGCKPEMGCVHDLNTSCVQDCQTNTECDDHNPCTEDACDGGKCVHNPMDGEACDDGNKCTYKDYCEGPVCKGHAGVDCNDDDPCTNDGCIPLDGCLHQFNSGSCDDGDACTSGDYCSEGDCLGGKPKNCDDGNVCTEDYCSPTGFCPATSVTPTGTDVDPVIGAACCHIGCDQPNPNCTSDGCRCGKTGTFCDPKIADTCDTTGISIGGSCSCGKTGGPCTLFNSCCINGKCTTSCK